MKYLFIILLLFTFSCGKDTSSCGEYCKKYCSNMVVCMGMHCNTVSSNNDIDECISSCHTSSEINEYMCRSTLDSMKIWDCMDFLREFASKTPVKKEIVETYCNY